MILESLHYFLKLLFYETMLFLNANNDSREYHLKSRFQAGFSQPSFSSGKQIVVAALKKDGLLQEIQKTDNISDSSSLPTYTQNLC